MPSPLAQAGALAEPSEFAPLHTNRFMTGLWTNRNQLRDAATTFLYEKFYSASRFDSLLGGLNAELTPKMTLARRPGHSVYNSAIFPPIRRFYSFNKFSTTTETIRLMADTDSAIYDATGPDSKVNIWNKSTLAGKSTFQSVGNTLYWGDGADQKKWLQSNLAWAPHTLFDGAATSNVPLGDWIVDTNHNIQKAVGAFTVGMTRVAITNDVLTLTLDQTQLQNPGGVPSGAVGTGGALPTAPIYARVAATNALGLLTAAGGESALVPGLGPTGSIQWTWAPVVGAVSYRLYVGSTPGGEASYFTANSNSFTQTVAAGIAGQPPEANNAFDDGLPSNLAQMVGVRLVMRGATTALFLNAQTITIATVSPGGDNSNVLTAVFVHADYPAAAETGTATSGTGITGATEPPDWATTLGGVTRDDGVQWICRGNYVQDWGIKTPAKAPSLAQASGLDNLPFWTPGTYFTTSGLITDAAGFIQKVTSFGTTGSILPNFNDATAGTTADGSVIWTCQGAAAYAQGAVYAKGAYIAQADAFGRPAYYQAQSPGTSGAVLPIFPAPLGAQVNDNGVVWQNIGIGQTWDNVTSATLQGRFGLIPLAGGGTVAIGAGQGDYGSVIPLPAGFNATNMLAWTSPNTGYDRDQQITGVDVSTASAGVLQAGFHQRSGGQTHASSNWAAVAWTSNAAVHTAVVGAFLQISFTTANGDQMVVTYGTQSGGAIPVPAGFLAANWVGIAGMAAVSGTGNGLQGVQFCTIDAALNLATSYEDGSTNTWTGAANVLGFFYKAGGGITSIAVTGGTAIIVPLPGLLQMAIIQANVASGATFGVPPGFDGGSLIATCAMSGHNGGTGSQVAHGWSSSVTGRTYTGTYSDGGGVYTTGHGNILALSVPISTTPISPASEIDDSNGNLQQIAVSGVSGEAAPAWAVTAGTLTIDNAATWLNIGIGSAAATAPSTYGYAYRNSVDKHVGTASPASLLIQRNAGKFIAVQGLYSNDPQVDLVVIYRTAKGGSTLLYLDEIPNIIGGAAMWNYRDTLDDTYLNELLPAAIAHANDPPPTGFRPLAYHLNRIFGALDNTLSWSNGTNQTGDPNQSFPPLNNFVYPSKVTRAWACTLGLIVFTVKDVYIVEGSATAQSPLTTRKYIGGLGLLSYDAFTVNKTTPYLMNSSNLVIALDPSSGLIEPGFPIADQFDQFYDASTAQLTWHEGRHGDTALFAGDGASSWFRMAALSAPEQGLVWSARGTLAAGYGVMASMEVAPGQKQLLLGPAAPGPILFRDPKVNTDNGALFAWYALIGSIVLAQPGQLAEIGFFTLESVKTGTRPTMGVLLGEIDGATSGTFEQLKRTRQDPPLLKPSKTLFGDRYAMMQGQNPVGCRHLQIRFDWIAEDAHNELLTYTIFGALHNEMTSK